MTLEPATAVARDVVNAMAHVHHVLVSTDGPHNNVIKIKPPLTFGKQEADAVAAALDAALTDVHGGTLPRAKL